jgi:Ca-activated chloride channel family protein
MKKLKIKYSSSFILSLSILTLALSQTGSAQSSYDMIKKGNQQFEQKKYTEAEVNYRKTITTGKNVKEGSYNLGNAYFKQGKYEEAAKQYESAGALKSLSPDEISKIYHNLGNAFLKEEKYQESINSYKNALKANPKDNDTRYNLAYAQSRLQQQQQQQNKDDKKDQNKEQKQDQQKQNQDQQKQDQQKQDQQNQEQKEKDEKGEPNQAKKDKISKEDADKILQALNNDEKKTQKKINTKEAAKVSIEKQW